MEDNVKKKYQELANTSDEVNQGSVRDNYYQMAKNQEYSSLLDKEIELENAKAAAFKQTNNQMAAQGFSTQGYGSSVHSGMGNKYLAAYENAKTAYQTNVNNLNQQQRQEQLNEANDRFGSVTTMLSQAETLDQMYGLLSDYGYGTITEDENGNSVFNWNNKPKDISDDDWNQMRYYFNLQKYSIENSQARNYTTYGNLDSWKSASFVRENGSAHTIGDEFAYESDALWANISAGKYAYGTTVMMKNGAGDVIYVQWTQNGLRMVDKSVYDTSANTDKLIWNENVSNK